MEQTNNVNIARFKPLMSPAALRAELPESDTVAHVVAAARRGISDILANRDKRRVVITGPCSLHDRDATLEYAAKLRALQDRVADKVLLVMRAYFEKPRTTLGWKGMLYDPRMDNSYDIEEGFRRSRALLLGIGQMGLPTATEFLDPIVPQYIADVIAWAAIGARTSESQIHRQMASGLSMPIGFKNSMDGNLATAVDAIKAAASGHCFMGIDENGTVVIAETRGNAGGHIVMRGGAHEPNYGSEYVAFASVLLQKAGMTNGVIIDCSHANSEKDYTRQRTAFLDVLGQIRQGNTLIAGMMLESFLQEGNQPFDTPDRLKYGMSVTDKCIGWDETEELICSLAGV